jgi:hypothetical protein
MGRTDLLSLVVRLACVEVRMGVEDRSLAEVCPMLVLDILFLPTR